MPPGSTDFIIKSIHPLSTAAVTLGALCLLLIGSSLAAHDHGEASIQVETLAQSTRSWDKQKLPPYPQGQPQITVLRITVPPHTALPMHKHPVINVGVLISGELIVTDIHGEQFHLKAGEPIVELVDKWHYGKNPRDEAAVIIVFYAGVIDTPVTLLKQDNGPE